jgi:hypothetical protein
VTKLDIDALADNCTIAPYGDLEKMKTVVNENVRVALECDTKRYCVLRVAYCVLRCCVVCFLHLNVLRKGVVNAYCVLHAVCCLLRIACVLCVKVASFLSHSAVCLCLEFVLLFNHFYLLLGLSSQKVW